MINLIDLKERIEVNELIVETVNDITYDFISNERLKGDYKEIINFIAEISLETNLNLVLTKDDYSKLWSGIRSNHKVTELVFKLISELTLRLGKDVIDELIKNVHSSIIITTANGKGSAIVTTDSDLASTISNFAINGLGYLNANKWIIPLYFINSSLLESLKIARS